ncbi:uncharacterized protein BXZ73DRAFT_77478 [Epithele typhae]|uniref:uncharacterized protein n=1 Tax=Epithele typhae TaxID=378194 RepID=UPI0020084767|nr:uncharacterized protein BXZ73DRAFT_77478 [Epithele typhae]KAH9932780.1 hypothetical protein BXZ73DRAFT_77478 [Epithele typhae]
MKTQLELTSTHILFAFLSTAAVFAPVAARASPTSPPPSYYPCDGRGSLSCCETIESAWFASKQLSRMEIFVRDPSVPVGWSCRPFSASDMLGGYGWRGARDWMHPSLSLSSSAARGTNHTFSMTPCAGFVPFLLPITSSQSGTIEHPRASKMVALCSVASGIGDNRHRPRSEDGVPGEVQLAQRSASSTRRARSGVAGPCRVRGGVEQASSVSSKCWVTSGTFKGAGEIFSSLNL